MTQTENPYVGPRTYLREESGKFYGREQEARDLLALVVSERLVLFYAQSGAGKSSLVNTRIIPGLEEKGFEVLPVGRVSGEPLAGCEADNIYLFNLMRSLVQHDGAADCLTGLSLADFLAHLNRDEQGYFYDSSPLEMPVESAPAEAGQAIWPRALIIDQFEEIISTHPEAWECRADLFQQIAAAMQADPYLWVLLVMREDYVAALDPYAHLVPGGLRARYYMQQMNYTTALEVIQKPVQNTRPYTPGAAEKLVDDLRAVQVQSLDGSTSKQLGQYVEPVQLQVVCLRLWEKLPPGGREITSDDLSAVGDVDQSLAEYYSERVADIAKKTGVKERRIRDWINTHLITGQGIRGQVLAEPRQSGGMDNQVIRLLEDAHLVRAEKRGGASWYELTHDRLVEPVTKNNAAWVRDHLSLLQRQAALWEQQHRSEDLLLRGKAFYEAQDWAARYPDELNDTERDFVTACEAALEREKAEQEHQAQAVKLEAAEKMAEVERRRAAEQASAARKLRASAVIMAVLLLAAVAFGVLTLISSRAAAASAKEAVIQRAAAETAALAENLSRITAVSAKDIAETATTGAALDRAIAVTAATAAAQGQSAAQTEAAKVELQVTRAEEINAAKGTVIAGQQTELAVNQTAAGTLQQQQATTFFVLGQYQAALALNQTAMANLQSSYNKLATQNSGYQRTAGVTPLALPTRIVIKPPVITPGYLGTQVAYTQPTATLVPSTYSYLGITLANIRLNGFTDNSITVHPGDNIRVQFEYRVDNIDCPTCVVQIQVGFSSENNPQQCVNAGAPAKSGVQGSANLTVRAPSNPGKYYLAFDRALEVRCVTEYWWTGSPNPGQFMRRVFVQ